MNSAFYTYLLKQTGATEAVEYEVIQSLWSGYGQVTRYTLLGSAYPTVVIKHIDLSHMSKHPRGWNTDVSHQRKVKSYEVETEWYQTWSTLTNASCRIPMFLGSYAVANEQWIILEDLDEFFPLRKQELNLNEIKNCLKWLAEFHGIFLQKEPACLWEVGTYWHLATRPEELEALKHIALKSNAEAIDKRLNQCKFKTIVHGDAKLANFCFGKNGEVAVVDFQYVGGGCGMKDVNYFLGSCMSGAECEQHEIELLDFYFKHLKKAVDLSINFSELEQEWRAMYSVASADFMRFLLGWMPTHHKINDYEMKKVDEALQIIRSS